MLRTLGVIPARYASTRFPGKPLAPLGNGTLLSAVWSSAAKASRLTRVIVATEDQRIVDPPAHLGVVLGRHRTNAGHRYKVWDHRGKSQRGHVRVRRDQPMRDQRVSGEVHGKSVA